MENYLWWKHGVIYQLYPRSFYDSNSDGIGDIRGIIEKLDYLTDLGIDAIWLSPIYSSPMYDHGYDIREYRSIDPVYGTMDDFMRLLHDAHDRNIRIIMDLVLNHTSYLHPWFLAARCSRENAKRDWYIWGDGNREKPPNNWKSAFGGSTWEWDELTRQFYLHSFLKEQPDVNWRNIDLKKAMFDTVRYWLDRGVDGFRLDAVNWLIKDARLRNNPFSWVPHHFRKRRYDRNRPETHDIMTELRKLLDEYEGRIAVGEVFTMPPGDPELSASYLGNGEDELHLAFDFSLMYRWWSGPSMYRCINRWMSSIPERGWPCHVLSNHDQPRSISRFGGGKDAVKRAMVAATLLLTLRGTPFIYYGEEIGMKNIKIQRNEICDHLGKRYWPFYAGRDPSRTPMQWSEEAGAGFTTDAGWLPVNEDFERVNVRVSSEDEYSLLNCYRSLIMLRKEKEALQRGSWVPLIKGKRDVISYLRAFSNRKICVVLNLSGGERKFRISDRGQWKVIFSTHKPNNRFFTDLHFQLAPYEATLVERVGEI